MKKCFLLCNILAVLLILPSCGDEPVYVADRIDADELWTTAVDTVEMSETTPEWDGVTVYYTKSGSVWHKTSECPALKNSENVICATQDQAVSEGKTRACKKCS